MSKKKAIKLAAATAVAASAFVAAAPAQTDAASNVATEVSKAVTQIKKAYHTYSDVTATGKFADIKAVYVEYNAAKKAYANAKAVVTKAGGATKDAYLAQLDSTYAEYISKRVVTYIDAYNYATTLADKQADLEAAVVSKDWDGAEKLYHAISYELKTRTVILDRVYGKTTRELLRTSFKADAQAARDSIAYEVTVKIALDKAEALVDAGKLVEAKAQLDKAAENFAKVSKDAEFGKALATAQSKVVAAYEAKLTPAVESVTAINVKEVKVTFNKALSKASLATTDFVVKTTAGATPVAVTDAQLSADGKTVTLLLASVIPATGVDIELAEGALLTTSFDKVVKSSTKELRAAEDKTAPKLLSATYVGGADIELTFDEPVDWATNSPTASINQTSVAAPSVSTVAGKYVYTISAGSALANGTHSVDLTNVTDFAGNKDVLIAKDVTVTVDNSATRVATISAEDSTSFIVEFSKAVALPVAANFEIKKGNLTLDSNNFTVAPSLVDKDGNAVAAGVTSSKYVKVTVDETVANTSNPLYATNENSVALAVKVSGYTDASSVLGTDFTGTVTLSKDTTAPAIKSDKLISSTANTIVVPFNKTLSGTVTASQVTVKQGNVLVAQTPTAAGSNLTLTFGAGVLEAGKTYTITLGKGAVTDSSSKANESVTFTYTVPATTVSHTTTAPTAVVSKTVDKNVITLTYAGKVNDAAALASSYKLNDASLPAGTDVYFSDANKDEVVIVLPASYAVSAEGRAAKFTINASTVQYDSTVVTVGGKFVSGSATAATANEQVIALKDNVAPTVTKVEYVKNAAGLATGLKLTFSENVDDSTIDTDFVVKQGATTISYTVATGLVGTADLVDDKVVNLTFGTTATASGIVLSTVTASGTTLDAADLNGNVLQAITGINAQ